MGELGGLTAKRWRRRIGWGVLLLVALGAAAVWLAVSRPWELKPTIVSVETVKPAPASRILAVNGRVTPKEQVEISSTINGRVVSVAANEGDTVVAGTVLAFLDDTQQRAEVAQAGSQVDSAEAQLKQARVDLKRAEGLRASISQKAVDSARLAVDMAQKQVEQLRARLEQAQSLLADYTVKAPFPGTILSRSADPGQVVGPATSLFQLADVSSLNAEASIDELYAAEVRRGLPVKARPEGQGDIIDGEVVYVSPRVDASTGGRLVRVTLPGAGDRNLPVGLTVMLNIVVERRASAITIPRSALLAGDKPAVYLMENGRAVRRPVQYVDWPSDRLIVTNGLAGGEALIADSRLVQAEGALVAAEK